MSIETLDKKSESNIAQLLAKLNSAKEAIAKKPIVVLAILAAVLVIVIVLYLFVGTGRHTEFILIDRLLSGAVIVLVAVAVGYSTVVFQTVTGARILTPGVLGLENIYLFLQTLFVFMFAATPFLSDDVGNFAVSVVFMVGFSLLIFMPLLTKGSKGVYVLLLVGIILSSLFASLNSFMHLIIDADTFMTVQGRMFTAFDMPDTLIMIIAAGVIALVIALAPSSRRLDVISLGRDNAISLGINHKWACMRILIIVAALVSVSTVIAGPIMFLGLIAANLAYHFIKSYKHVFTIPAAMLIGAIALFASEFFIREVFTININVAVVINFFGGIYFIFLLLRERKKEK